MEDDMIIERLKAARNKARETGKLFGMTLHPCKKCGRTVLGALAPYCYDCGVEVKRQVEAVRLIVDDELVSDAVNDTRYYTDNRKHICSSCGCTHIYDFPFLLGMCPECYITANKGDTATGVNPAEPELTMSVDVLLGLQDGGE